MTELEEIYKCTICGNIVEVIHTGQGELVCCGQPMEKQNPKTEDAATEKHVPYIERTDEGILVRIGQNQDHPMEEKHYIEWIQLIADGKSYRSFLKPGDKPQALFPVSADTLEAREYCNIHGLWKNTN
ncbi:MAG: desulfoferrodoxin [Candidatus Thermoplasmatota archaeon]|nr:desulfoferrodoxin [Candidatus Thermoplasmatota archaeon]